jgi:hypothetical protein
MNAYAYLRILSYVSYVFFHYTVSCPKKQALLLNLLKIKKHRDPERTAVSDTEDQASSETDSDSGAFWGATGSIMYFWMMG